MKTFKAKMLVAGLAVLVFAAPHAQGASNLLINATFDYPGDVVGGLPSPANGGPSGVANNDGAFAKSFITNGNGLTFQSLASGSFTNVGGGTAFESLYWDTGGGAGLNYTYVTNTFGTDKNYLRVSFDVNPNGQMEYRFNTAANFVVLTLNNTFDGSSRIWRVVAGDAPPKTTNTFGSWDFGVVQNVLVEVDLRNSLYRLVVDGVYGPQTPMPVGIAYSNTPTPVNSSGFGRFHILNDRQVHTSFTDNFRVEVWDVEIPEPTTVTLLGMAGLFWISRRFLRRSK